LIQEHYYRLYPLSQEADDILVIHSLGEYEKVRFEVTFEELVM